MKFVRSLFALVVLATVSACAAQPVATPSPTAPVIERAEPVAAPEVTTVDASGLPLSYSVYFDTNSAEIRASTMQVLWEAAQNASKLKPLTIHVQGFTDGSGSRAANQRLSERRAAAVAAQLAKLGITVRVESRGLGERKGKQKDAHSRRVEITFERSTTAAAPAAAQTARTDASMAYQSVDVSPMAAVATTAIITAAPAGPASPGLLLRFASNACWGAQDAARRLPATGPPTATG